MSTCVLLNLSKEVLIKAIKAINSIIQEHEF